MNFRFRWIVCFMLETGGSSQLQGGTEMKQKAVAPGAMLVVLVLFAGAGSIVRAGQAGNVDVSGVWAFVVESAAGTGMPTVTITQRGDNLTGHYSSQLLGEAELVGTIKAQAIEFTVSADVQGTKVELKYSGTVGGKDSMKGKLSAGELGDGTFTAKRK
jgi:hypothetical protein